MHPVTLSELQLEKSWHTSVLLHHVHVVQPPTKRHLSEQPTMFVLSYSCSKFPLSLLSTSNLHACKNKLKLFLKIENQDLRCFLSCRTVCYSSHWGFFVRVRRRSWRLISGQRQEKKPPEASSPPLPLNRLFRSVLQG